MKPSSCVFWLRIERCVPSRGRGRRAFALLLTLVLLVLVSVVLLDIARRSVRAAGAAVQAQTALQRRWGAASCRKVLLQEAPTILGRARARRGRPAASVTATLTLGGQRFELTVSDEQAKVNINEVYQRRGREGADQMVHRLAGAAGGGPPVFLQPDRSAAQPRSVGGPGPGPGAKDRIGVGVAGGVSEATGSKPTSGRAAADAPAGKSDGDASPARTGEGDAASPSRPPPAFGSWAQVFLTPTAGALFGDGPGGGRPVAQLTLWGDGRLNVARASPTAIRTFCRSLLSPAQIEKLIAARKARPGGSLGQWLSAVKFHPAPDSKSHKGSAGGQTGGATEGVTEGGGGAGGPAAKQADSGKQAAALLTDRSRCYAVWVTTDDGRRVDHEVAVEMPPRVGASGRNGKKPEPRVERLVW